MRFPTRFLAKETLFVAASLLCTCLIVAFTSFINAGLDLEAMLSAQSLPDAILNAAITVFCTIAAVPSGVSATKQRRNADGTPGKYLQDFTAYNNIRLKVEPKRVTFNQWHKEQHLKEQRQKCVEFLLSKGVSQAEDILELSKEQVRKLTTSQYFKVEGRELYFKSLTSDQITACLKVLSGKIVVHKLPDFYFLYYDGMSSRTFYDQAYYEAKDERRTLALKLASKISLGFVITCIFTGLVITASEDLSSTEYVIRAVITTLSRVFSAVSSTLWGWLLGQEMVYKQCYYLNGRTQFLELFDNDVDFVPKSLQEQAKLDYETEKGSVTYENLEHDKVPNSILD